MEREWQSMIIMSIFFILSLVGAVVLFYFLESYAEVTNPNYRLGGAAAGFFVFFITLVGAYSRVVAKPASKLMREAGRAITKPKGFREYVLPENGFSVYYPEEWTVDKKDQFPTITFCSEDGTNVNICTDKLEKDFMVEYEKNPSQLPAIIEKIFGDTFKDFEIEEKSTIALHGKHHPMIVMKRAMGNINFKHVQIYYLDEQAKKFHAITFTVGINEYEEMKPLWEKILSTFQILEK